MALFIGLEVINAGLLYLPLEHMPSKCVILGYLQTVIHLLMLVGIPLVLAAKYRDEVSVQSLPLAGQLLAMT